jgi:hypothetical protein
MNTNRTARKIKNVNSHQILWEALPRIEGYKFVITSTSNVQFTGPETYMFAADEKGNIIDWCELPGSYRGELNHEKCFEEIGYKIDE